MKIILYRLVFRLLLSCFALYYLANARAFVVDDASDVAAAFVVVVAA